MSVNSLNSLFNTDAVENALKDIDATRLSMDLQAPTDAPDDEAIALLRLAAIAAITNLLGNEPLDTWLRQRSQTTPDNEMEALSVFARWNGYFNALIVSGTKPDIDDLLYFTIAGLLARRPNEVRDALRCPIFGEWIKVSTIL
jgi:hypothetical protein